MKYLIISDLHANTEALDAVLEHAGALGYDAVVCLGDLVGYGPEPNQLLERLRSLEGLTVIRGNHDKVAAGLENGDEFNSVAGLAAQWTAGVLSEKNRDFLAGLPAGPLETEHGFWLAHGTPLDEDAYILNDFDALEVFSRFEGGLCFFGHSHLPSIFALSERQGLLIMAPTGSEALLELEPGTRYLINPGSVGQPRDRNPDAAYAIYDTDTRTVQLLRVAYPLEQTQRKIRAAQLPEFLADRLGVGV